MSHKLDMSSNYFIPNSSVIHETVVKKSRFITCIHEVHSKDEALDHIRAITAKEIGANHNCYAFIVGSPSSPVDIHCSDDGEPSGTAGRAMLHILQYENIGNVLVVVTRYFGGIKLGSGGLVRAYSNGLKLAIDEIGLKEYVEKKRVTVSLHYQFEGSFRHICSEYGVVTLDTVYGEEVRFILEIIEENVDPFLFQLRDLTSGQIKVERETGEDNEEQ
ncbi:YigZ family protein [Desulforhopalus sp. 52FAK]